jgi:hypothetical protein
MMLVIGVIKIIQLRKAQRQQSGEQRGRKRAYRFENSNFHERLIMISRLVLDDFDSHVRLCRAILTFNNLTKCSLAKQFKHTKTPKSDRNAQHATQGKLKPQ